MKFDFNHTALTNPTTMQEYIALLDEALRLVDELTEMTFSSTKRMEESMAVA